MPKVESFNKEIICIIFLLSLFFNIYGVKWGLPARWNVDQTVSASLHLIGDKTIFPRDNIRPAFYYYLNLLVLLPYFIYLKLTAFPIEQLVKSAQVSWNAMALSFPQVAKNIFIISRLLSAVCGSLTVLVLYRIGKIVFSHRVGLIAAALLSMTMGFIVFNHFARSVALINLLSTICIYYCLKSISSGIINKNFYFACMLAGLGSAVKFNGFFLLFPVIMTFYLTQRQKKYLLDKRLLLGITFFILTFAFASPNFIFKAIDGLRGVAFYGRAGYLPNSFKESIISFPGNFFALIGTVLNIFGLPLGISSVLGLVYVLYRYFYKREIKIISLFILFVFFIFSLLPRIKTSSDSKFVIQLVPFLVLAAAVLLDNSLLRNIRKQKTSLIFNAFIILLIFGWSLFYSLSVCLIFKKNDIRYTATKWLSNNLPAGSKIILIEELEWSLGLDILDKFDVVVLAIRDGNDARPMNYKFVSKKYSVLDNEEIILFKRQIQQLPKGTFLVIPYSNFESQEKIGNFISKGLKIIRVFERVSPWYFNPNLAGYEPDKIFLLVSAGF